ncbi:hypothetical protein RUM44_005607 [Polyplax serrata]|uniref:Ig-like domain-containing protein n=1 Tax=Polyplax serrata TaxID=468196 RepID=A0ABR1AEA7_POLSC
MYISTLKIADNQNSSIMKENELKSSIVLFETLEMGHLEIVVPPDIISDESSDNGVALEGGSVRLRCKATGVPDPTVQWRREDSKNIVLRHEGGREKTVERIIKGDILSLTNVQRSDIGIYLCIASNGVPPSVSKRFMIQVHFQPSIQVTNQLVAAPVGSDVILQCYVEASPKAMNSWYKEKGEKLMGDVKYALTEQPVSEYGLMMNLTIRSIEKRDLGAYMCSSSNALGTASGAVRLQGFGLENGKVFTVEEEEKETDNRLSFSLSAKLFQGEKSGEIAEYSFLAPVTCDQEQPSIFQFH